MAENEEDRAAIIALIHANRIAMWTQDYEAYQACFVQAGYTTRWGWWRPGGPFFRRGWEDISARVREQFKDPTFNIPRNAYDTTVENLNLHIGADMAWATFEQIYPRTLYYGSLRQGPTNEVRFLEKHDGKWRIAFLGFIDTESMPSDAAILKLSAEGQVLWQSPPAVEALAASDDLVIRNGKLRIRERRLDQKLQAAIAWAGSLDTAVMSSRGAVPILIERGEGLPTQICWVIGEGGMVSFSFDHAGLSQARLDMAAIIYQLSPMQRQLAGHVAQGLSLPEIAIAMGVTTNTARTHLNRVFEKTGVHSQPALVRVLLSAASPV
ncbi:MAG: helix-turn-helix transcriptional regulator [Devosia sp.]